MSASYVVQIAPEMAKKLMQELDAKGFEITRPAHTHFQAKISGISVTAYLSGKLVVQGSKSRDFIESFLEPEILGTFQLGYEHLNLDLTPHIGVDESGKGDFFGPLCVAGVFAQGKEIEELQKLGVKDSKKLDDKTIEKLARSIRKAYPHHIVRINPEKYNELHTKFGNLNHLLGWGHATVIDYLLELHPCEKVVIDQFAAEHVVEKALKQKKRNVLLVQMPRAEADLVVAAASILARAAFLEGLHKLSETFGLPLPKGASAAVIAAGKKMVEKYGEAALGKVAKTHFKTTREIVP